MVSRLILVLILAASVWYFFRVLARRLHTIRTAKPALPWDHLPRRLWRVFLEVMLQTRVIRDRPLAGFLHALVMWGFFAFLWVSIEHFTAGLRGLEHAQRDASWYGAFVAFWAVAVSVGILGLAFRRFVLRPRALGAPSLSSGVVAALVVLLMVTYWLRNKRGVSRARGGP